MTFSLTQQQRNVIQELREGKDYFYNSVTNYRPHTRYEYGQKAEMVHGTIMKKLEVLELIQKAQINTAIYQYSLTELGKTIKL
jgi:hypothetical protein